MINQVKLKELSQEISISRTALNYRIRELGIYPKQHGNGGRWYKYVTESEAKEIQEFIRKNKYSRRNFVFNNNIVEVKNDMTCLELANLMGVSRQSINNYINDLNLQTYEDIAPAGHGRARFIHKDDIYKICKHKEEKDKLYENNRINGIKMSYLTKEEELARINPANIVAKLKQSKHFNIFNKKFSNYKLVRNEHLCIDNGYGLEKIS
ncbi:YfeC-like transcriptional regulator [Francisella marina]|nr:YfeC-like transcriptional regulator [Francisella marina]